MSSTVLLNSPNDLFYEDRKSLDKSHEGISSHLNFDIATSTNTLDVKLCRQYLNTMFVLRTKLQRKNATQWGYVYELTRSTFLRHSVRYSLNSSVLEEK